MQFSHSKQGIFAPARGVFRGNPKGWAAFGAQRCYGSLVEAGYTALATSGCAPKSAPPRPQNKRQQSLEADPRVESRVYETEPDWHRHDFCQVLFGLSGQSELEMDGHAYRASVTSGVIVPAGCRHDFLGDAENCQLVVDLPLDSIAIPHALLDKPRAFALPMELGATLSRFAATCSPMRLRQHDWQLAVHAVGHVVKLLGGEPGDVTAFPVKQIEAYLRSHLGHPMSSQALATHFGWGMRRFHDLFCEAFGDTPYHYQSRLRLDGAVRLLHDRALSLAEIAYLLGYADQQTFTRRFSERFGVSPGRWRALQADA